MPAENIKVKEPGYAIVRIDGRILISERNDENSVSVSCELQTGKHFDIEDH